MRCKAASTASQVDRWSPPARRSSGASTSGDLLAADAQRSEAELTTIFTATESSSAAGKVRFFLSSRTFGDRIDFVLCRPQRICAGPLAHIFTRPLSVAPAVLEWLRAVFASGVGASPTLAFWARVGATQSGEGGAGGGDGGGSEAVAAMAALRGCAWGCGVTMARRPCPCGRKGGAEFCSPNNKQTNILYIQTFFVHHRHRLARPRRAPYPPPPRPSPPPPGHGCSHPPPVPPPPLPPNPSPRLP